MFSPSPLFIGSTYFLKLIAAFIQMKKYVLISIYSMILMLLQLKGHYHSILIYKCMQISFHAL